MGEKDIYFYSLSSLSIFTYFTEIVNCLTHSNYFSIVNNRELLSPKPIKIVIIIPKKRGSQKIKGQQSNNI